MINVAPLPPRVTLEQVKAFVAFMDKDARGAAQAIADSARQIIGGGRERP